MKLKICAKNKNMTGKEFIYSKYQHLTHPAEGKNPIIDFELEDLGLLFEEYAKMVNSKPVYAKEGDYCAVCGSTEFWNDEEE